MCGCNSNFTGSQEEKSKLEQDIKKLEYQASQILQVLKGSAPSHVKQKYVIKRNGILKDIEEKKAQLNAKPEKNVLAPKGNWKKYALIGAVGIVGAILIRKFVFKNKGK